MTEEQVKKWQQRRDEAKAIEDPAARAAALDIVYDMKDDMQLDCQRKMADRIKDLVVSNEGQSIAISKITSELGVIKSQVADHESVVAEVKTAKIRSQGAWMLLKIIGWSAAVGGSGAIGWWAALAKKASEGGM